MVLQISSSVTLVKLRKCKGPFRTQQGACPVDGITGLSTSTSQHPRGHTQDCFLNLPSPFHFQDHTVFAVTYVFCFAFAFPNRPGFTRETAPLSRRSFNVDRLPTTRDSPPSPPFTRNRPLHSQNPPRIKCRFQPIKKKLSQNCGAHQSGKKTTGREGHFSLVTASGRGPGFGLGQYDLIGRRNVDNRRKPTFCNKTSLSPRSGGGRSQSECRHAESLLNGRCPREAVTQGVVAEAELRRGQRNAGLYRPSVRWLDL